MPGAALHFCLLQQCWCAHMIVPAYACLPCVCPLLCPGPHQLPPSTCIPPPPPLRLCLPCCLMPCLLPACPALLPRLRVRG